MGDAMTEAQRIQKFVDHIKVKLTTTTDGRRRFVLALLLTLAEARVKEVSTGEVKSPVLSC